LPAVDLSNKRFEVPVYFKDTVFHEGVNFYSVEFNREADFREARFSLANFSKAKFLFADFNGVTFSFKSSFVEAKFLSKADFREARFSLANFMRATFSEADFRRATFSELAVFEEVKFLGKALFDSATFLNTVSFVNADFSPNILEKCLDPYSYISFRYTNFKKQEKVLFVSCNMERVSFINTNIKRVRFGKAEWGDYRIYDEKLLLLKGSKEERKKFIENGKRKLTEISNVSKERILEILIGKSKANKIEEEIVKALELRIPEVLNEIKWLIQKEKTKDEEDKLNQLLKEFENEVDKIKSEAEKAINRNNEEIEEGILKVVRKDKDLALYNVLVIYRGLRENCNYYLKHDESGKFFINEMKLKKYDKKFNSIFRIRRGLRKFHNKLSVSIGSLSRKRKNILKKIPIFILYGVVFIVSFATVPLYKLIERFFGSLSSLFLIGILFVGVSSFLSGDPETLGRILSSNRKQLEEAFGAHLLFRYLELLIIILNYMSTFIAIGAICFVILLILESLKDSENTRVSIELKVIVPFCIIGLLNVLVIFLNLGIFEITWNILGFSGFFWSLLIIFVMMDVDLHLLQVFLE
jgi:uncharacterized protein YjbI with pentapeptide repeats/energy-converting hydrogenase Eha subunit A